MDKLASKREQLRREVWARVQIYVTSLDNLLYVKYLYKPDTKEELNYINTSTHLKVIRIYLWRLCLIEIAKLVSSKKGDDFRIVDLIDRLKKSGHYGDLKIDPAKIKKWEEK